MLAIFLALGPCHANTATTVNNSKVITTMDTGGDAGHIPTDPPPPPPLPWPW